MDIQIPGIWDGESLKNTCCWNNHITFTLLSHVFAENWLWQSEFESFLLTTDSDVVWVLRTMERKKELQLQSLKCLNVQARRLKIHRQFLTVIARMASKVAIFNLPSSKLCLRLGHLREGMLLSSPTVTPYVLESSEEMNEIKRLLHNYLSSPSSLIFEYCREEVSWQHVKITLTCTFHPGVL